MNLGVFRNMLAGFMGRETGVFVVNGVNFLDRAVNQARKWAERQHRFECAKDSAVVRDVSLTDGGLLTSAVSTTQPGRRVSVRTIERAFLPFSDGGHLPIEVVSRDSDIRALGREFQNLTTLDSAEAPVLGSGPFRLVRWGDRLYISPLDTNTTDTERDVYMDVVMWLPDYTKDSDSDFFLEHCEDFMLLRAAYQLNFMLKEDQRVQITDKALLASWETVLKVDNDAVTGSSDDVSLD